MKERKKEGMEGRKKRINFKRVAHFGNQEVCKRPVLTGTLKKLVLRTWPDSSGSRQGEVRALVITAIIREVQ
jgi:hypothetical protein